MYAVCCEFTGCKMTIKNQIIGDRHVVVVVVFFVVVFFLFCFFQFAECFISV